MSSTAVRVPVIEPSGVDFDTHVTLNESDGSVAEWHQSFLYGNPPARLDTDGSIAAKGAKYRYAHGMLDHVAPPTTVYNDQLGAVRNHSGHSFATGTGSIRTVFSQRRSNSVPVLHDRRCRLCIRGQRRDYATTPVAFSGTGVVPAIQGAISYQSTSPSIYDIGLQDTSTFRTSSAFHRIVVRPTTSGRLLTCRCP